MPTAAQIADVIRIRHVAAQHRANLISLAVVTAAYQAFNIRARTRLDFERMRETGTSRAEGHL
jgi:hypothetical protein